MYQALFSNDEFAKVVPWLMLNREGLSVLVHPSTGDGYGDHGAVALAGRAFETQRRSFAAPH
jgi:DOPA 4,5-dioxygenase